MRVGAWPKMGLNISEYPHWRVVDPNFKVHEQSESRG